MISMLASLLFLIVFFLWVDDSNPLSYFKFYRKLRKGKWAKISSLVPFVPYRWIRVGAECDERVDEIYS